MTDYAGLLINLKGRDSKYTLSSDFNISGADDATVKALYEGIYSGDFCAQVSCFSDRNYQISPEMPDYEFELSAINRRVPKSEVEEHPNSLFYKAATDPRCFDGPSKGARTCLNNLDGDWVRQTLLNVGVYSNGKWLVDGRLEVDYLQREYANRDLANWTAPTKTESLTGIVEGLSLANATDAVLYGAGTMLAVAILAFGAKKVMKSFR